MPRARPNALQNFLSSVILPLLSVCLLPASLVAVGACLLLDNLRKKDESRISRSKGMKDGKKNGQGCVIISGGRMSKGLTLARAFKRSGWKVVGVEEEGWGELCPMRFSSSIDSFHLLPPASNSYQKYANALIAIAKAESATLFIPVSGAGSSVEDARAAETMSSETNGRCRTFIQDPGTMLDLHDKDRFMALVDELGFTIPSGKMIEGVDEGIEYLKGVGEKKFVLKCMGLDENRGDMTLFPLDKDKGLVETRKVLEGLNTKITKECPYVFQEYIPGPEWCTHASVINGRLTSFVACPSNDMLMTYENGTSESIGKRAEEWTTQFLSRLSKDKYQGKDRRLTGHFSFDFIVHSGNGELYPIECNARVHTAIIMLPLSKVAECYTDTENKSKSPAPILRPNSNTSPRSWIYNDLIMRYLPLLVPSPTALGLLHPSLPATLKRGGRPNEDPFTYRVDPTLVADDWIPFLVLWHLYWPSLVLVRWWKGIRWTRLNVSTGRIFEA